jgi:hypothetical protein
MIRDKKRKPPQKRELGNLAIFPLNNGSYWKSTQSD